MILENIRLKIKIKVRKNCKYIDILNIKIYESKYNN